MKHLQLYTCWILTCGHQCEASHKIPIRCVRLMTEYLRLVQLWSQYVNNQLSVACFLETEPLIIISIDNHRPQPPTPLLLGICSEQPPLCLDREEPSVGYLAGNLKVLLPLEPSDNWAIWWVHCVLQTYIACTRTLYERRKHTENDIYATLAVEFRCSLVLLKTWRLQYVLSCSGCIITIVCTHALLCKCARTWYLMCKKWDHNHRNCKALHPVSSNHVRSVTQLLYYMYVYSILARSCWGILWASTPCIDTRTAMGSIPYIWGYWKLCTCTYMYICIINAMQVWELLHPTCMCSTPSSSCIHTVHSAYTEYLKVCL